jgi:predicted nucleotidyltransferase
MHMTNPNIALPNDAIAEFCQRHHIRRLALFGSVLRDDSSHPRYLCAILEAGERGCSR